MIEYTAVRKLIDEMRKEATDLEEDTLTSMSEFACNARMAKQIREYADKLEKLMT